MPARRVPFLPWPQPAAIGMVAGVALGSALPAGARLPAAIALLVAALGAWALPLVRTRAPAARAGLLLTVALVAASFGLLRLAAFERTAHDALGELAGHRLTFHGRSDGATLHVTEPVRVKLALVAPRGGWAEGPPVGVMSVTGVAEPAPGKRNPGGFDYREHLRRRGVAGQLFVEEFDLSPRLPLRQRLQRGVAAGLSPEAGALMTALTLGLRDDLGELRETFTAAGMAHLLALSGLHVGVLLLAAERLLRPLGRLRTPALAVTALGFLALVGASPSVLRAVTMALAAVASRAFGAGRVQPWTALSLAALLGLAVAPQMLFDLAFQLSYLAVAGMLLFLPPWLARLGAEPSAAPEVALGAAPELEALSGAATDRLRRGLLSGLAVSVAAQLPSLSIVLGAFGGLPLLSPLVNVVAVPLTGLVVPVGFAAGVVGLLGEGPARLVNLAVAPLAGLLIRLAEVAAHLPVVAWGEVSWLGHACWAAFVAALAKWAHRPGRLKQTACVALAAGSVAFAVPPPAAPPDVWYLDVGQGDAALIRLGGGHGILVDGGGAPFSEFDVGERIVLPALAALGVRRLAAVIATHPDTDHIEGLIPVLERLPVGLLVTGPPDPAAALDVELRTVAARRGVPVHEAVRGERLAVGRGEFRLDLLNPAAGVTAPANERSVAFVLRHRGAARALFLGDLGLATEPELAVPRVEVLMVPHHGSKGSTGEGLLRAARPRSAVISVGRNNYGHPAPEVVERLVGAGAGVLTTREAGAVRFDLTGRHEVRGAYE